MRIVVDQREEASGIPRILKSMGVRIERRILEEGDYVVFPECAVERKEAHDFVQSLFKGRLFDQANRLSAAYKTPVIVVEGDMSTIMQGLSRPRSIWGALATLTLKHGIHLFFTNNTRETADLLYTLSKQQKSIKSTGPFVHRKFKKDPTSKTQIRILSTLPGIGPKLAMRLLNSFGSLRRIFSASIAELTLVEGIGRVKAGRIGDMLDRTYEVKEEPLEQKQLTDNS